MGANPGRPTGRARWEGPATKRFLDDDFLLDSASAQRLYNDYAKDLPIVDCHCHLSPREIAENRQYADMTELWLGGDHYKWRAMRACGVDERYITGDAAPYEKFAHFAAVMPQLAGNPLYHWTHMELKTYFGITEPLGPASCEAIWTQCNAQLPSLRVRDIFARSRVELVYTTDDPCDSLHAHEQLAAEPGSGTRVLPAWRPDKAMNIDKPGYAGYLRALSDAAGVEIRDFQTLTEALELRMAHFHAHGCRNSDHGLDHAVYRPGGDPDALVARAIGGQALTPEEVEQYQTALLLFLSERYAARGWVMQLHYGALRNVNRTMYARLGADTGYDAIRGQGGSGEALGALLGEMEARCALPKTVLYSLDPADNALLDALLGCFAGAGVRGRVQHGSAWWFNDSLYGMEAQLRSLASMFPIGCFIGMVTDSRSFLSYTRHDYFRRLLCRILGQAVEDGEYPADYDALGRIVQDVCYFNAKAFFGIGPEPDETREV